MAAMIGALDPSAVRGIPEWLTLWWWCISTIWSGSLALGFLRAKDFPAALMLETVIGIAATSLALLPIITWAGFTAWSAMTAWSLAITVCVLPGLARTGLRVTRLEELGLFLLCCASSYAWALPTSRAADVLVVTGRFPAWTDYFIHAGEIARFGPYAAFGRGLASMVDVAPGFYHLASYVLPATFASLSNATPLQVAVSTWLGMSFLMLTLGVAAVATALRGGTLAIASVAAVTAVPDPSFYWLGNGFFGFHWLLVTAPGSGYGIGIVSAATVLLLLWTSRPRKLLLVGSAVLGLCSVLLRVHCTMLFAPVWAAVTFARLGGASLQTQLVKLATIALVLTLLVTFVLVAPLREALGYRLDLLPYLDVIQHQDAMVRTDTVYTLLKAHSVVLAAIFGVAVLLLSAFGAPLLFYAAYLAQKLFGHEGKLTDFIPGLFVLSFVAVTVLAPPPWTGDITEFKHRGFVLVYAIIVPWAVLPVVELCRRLFPPPNRTFANLVFCLAGVVAIAVPLLFGRQMSTPRFAWAANFFNTRVDPALFSLAEHLRIHAGPRDVLTFDRPDPEVTLADQATVVTALTGMPAFVSRVKVYSLRSDSLAKTVQQRELLLKSVEEASSYDKAGSLLERAGIRWYLVNSSRPPQWDPTGAKADLKAGEWLLFRFDK
ncbi:hypothetical protein FJ434_27375 [Mesorhizobium sp. B2-5-13]|uniref:hypothetical protein n=1 Tax=unclassified Mesorhizobium TaxID=325217 RepID=UPI0011299244|nr:MULTISPECIES: hypothetical protein [unclassified Mesorhizobium]TPJ75511.1 hypothetical protein FJ434_27375 [Mesorhizobium sp. B2-5-13]TPK41453.1 hypothetical protein FJ560_27870 [Mesorhizobium sp. B2-5-5]